MANWLKDEIEHFGVTVDSSIQNASGKIQDHIDQIGLELSKQRNITKADIESLIDYAAEKFGTAIDERIDKAKLETASLITEKVGEIRQQLSEAANEQKRVALRNATVAVSVAIIVGAISLLYKRLLYGELDLLTISRAVLFAFACGHVIWLLFKYITEYFQSSRVKKNIFLIGAQQIGLFKVKGAAGHIVLLTIVVALWVTLNFWQQIKQLFI